jgi:hypothetical protein
MQPKKAKEQISNLVDFLISEGKLVIETMWVNHISPVIQIQYVDLALFKKWQSSCHLLSHILGNQAEPWRKTLEEDSENSYAVAVSIQGTLKAIREALDNDFLMRHEELIHADIFSDFLEMAGYLLTEGYKDAAAVIVGSVLEEHIRKLCAKQKPEISITSNGRPKKADTLNSELASAEVITKLDQKNITAWLDLRNKSAHGKYTEYTQQQVELLLQSVQDFLTRVPA